MTTVYVRLALDRLPPGAALDVTLKGEIPHKNVTSAVRQLGHVVEHSQCMDEEKGENSHFQLRIRKSETMTSASAPSA